MQPLICVEIDVAIGSAEKLVEKDPMNKTYHYNYGVLLLNAERYGEAETQLKKAIEIKGPHLHRFGSPLKGFRSYGEKDDVERRNSALKVFKYL